MSKELRLKEAIENAEANVLFLAGLPDKELSNRLDLVHIQMELAEQKRNTDSLELLEVWRSQLIEARIYKAENEIDDVPNEIELAIDDIETVVAKTEEREEIIEGAQTYQKVYKQKIKEDNSDQISLF
ncbi:MAG: hypothetical protein Q7W45_08025 [Bacteroidota bacterium]|nr:hypothetical protein [Bacteroidota bacterium]MDP3145958.1 hypothetical protein [Bacteroidota bacterium]MDP3558593.1 hypothetical protein [Bacteroidota bacterium]